MFIARLLILIFLLMLSGCGDILDDLNPAGNNKSSTGNIISADFQINDIDGNLVNISDELLIKDAVVLYFTMWCPACDSEMSHMQSTIIPDFPNVTFYAVDYLSGTIAQAKSNEGNAWPAFTTLADIDNILENAFGGTMGITVVIDKSKAVQMNELYDGGARLRTVLQGITP